MSRFDAQNMVEKIARKFAVGLAAHEMVQSGDFLSIRPAHVMTHDNTAAVIPKFRSIGATRIRNPRQPVFVLDHNVQDLSEANLAKYSSIEAFAREMGVDFYPAGRGIGHQVMCEEGYCWPGTLVVASDSHANMYGALGCLGTPVVRTDAAAIWATGRTWWQVPPVARCKLSGDLGPGVSGKDVILTLCAFFADEVINHAVEFVGEGIESLSMEDRLTIANMTTEWGALAGLFPVDRVTLDWLAQRIDYVGKREFERVPSEPSFSDGHPRLNLRRLNELIADVPHTDEGAGYAVELELDLGSVTPRVSGPGSVRNTIPLRNLRKTKVKIDKAYLVSCVNSRVGDLAAAAKAVGGRRVASGVEFYVAAASSEVQMESEKRGDWQALLDAGAIALPPGCGPCIGLGKGLLREGETGISATNRNFKGRMGSTNAQAFLASPPIVAASAVSGYIEVPPSIDDKRTLGNIMTCKTAATRRFAVSIIAGFPRVLRGEIVFCHQDNLNTDGIYPGKYTYLDDFTPEQQSGVAMENYDPAFKKLVRKGDILTGGFNFGTGSSREQAVTALKYLGVRLVLAGSFSETYKRNAFNNGFLALETPGLVTDLKAEFGTSALSVRTGRQTTIDFAKSELHVGDKTYPIPPLGAVAQELIVADGLENWVRENLE